MADAGVVATVTGNPAMSVPLHRNAAGLQIGVHVLGPVRRRGHPCSGSPGNWSPRGRGLLAAVVLAMAIWRFIFPWTIPPNTSWWSDERTSPNAA